MSIAATASARPTPIGAAKGADGSLRGLKPSMAYQKSASWRIFWFGQIFHVYFLYDLQEMRHTITHTSRDRAGAL